jgi:hypothetical protein
MQPSLLPCGEVPTTGNTVSTIIPANVSIFCGVTRAIHFLQYYKMEAEACDDYSDLTTGNSGGAYLQIGDLDVVKCS